MKKIILILIVLIIVCISLVYFFTSKKIKVCGSVLPISCRICECKRGFPLPSIGSATVTCFLGGEAKCGDFE